MSVDYDENINYTNYILNEKNKYITKEFIHELLEKYGIKYKVNNLEFFNRAMTHDSYLERDFTSNKFKNFARTGDASKLSPTEKVEFIGSCKIIKMVVEKKIEPIPNNVQNKKVIPLKTTSYERLEYLGDSVIHLILAEYLYKRYSDKDEGFMTKLRTKIENGQTLSQLARTLGLHEYVLIARYIEQIGGRDGNDHIFEDTFESLLGALYEDSGCELSLCKKLVVNIIEAHIDFAHMIYNETNYKDLLLQYHHRMKWPDPEYGLIEIVERNTKKYFNMYVKGGMNGVINGVGSGSSKKKGEQIAAENALKKFNVITDESDDESEIYEEY